MFEGIFCIVLFVVGLIFLKIAIRAAKFAWKNTPQVLGVLVGIIGTIMIVGTLAAATLLVILA